MEGEDRRCVGDRWLRVNKKSGGQDMSNRKFGGRVVRDPREIPANWMRLAELSNREDGKETDEYKAAYTACCTGEIPSDKCCKYKQTDRDSRGPIYADPDCIEKAIASWRARSTMLAGAIHVRHQKLPVPTEATEQLLDRVHAVLELIADALENIATRPAFDDQAFDVKY